MSSTVPHSQTLPVSLTAPLTFIRCIQCFPTMVPVLTLFPLSPIPVCPGCTHLPRCGMANAFCVPALIVWLCFCVQKDSVDIPGLSERVRDQSAKSTMATKLGVCWGWAWEAVGGEEQHTWDACVLCSRSRSYASPHPHKDFLAPTSEINFFLF